MKIHSLSTHHYADGGVGEVFTNFWSFRCKQHCSQLENNWSDQRTISERKQREKVGGNFAINLGLTDIIEVVADVGMKFLWWSAAKDLDLLTSGHFDQEVNSSHVGLDGWGLNILERKRAGDKTAYRHGVETGEVHVVWGVKCLETIPAGKVGERVHGARPLRMTSCEARTRISNSGA